MILAKACWSCYNACNRVQVLGTQTKLDAHNGFMKWADLLTGLGRHDKPLAFIFFAEVGTSVERSAYRLNPDLPVALLKSVLDPEPTWLGSRPLLKQGWPANEPTSHDDLIDRALLSCKAMLALGAQIPDGSFDEMQFIFDELFPSVAQERIRGRPDEVETRMAHVCINATGSHETWFQISPGRDGLEVTVPEPDATFTGRNHSATRWEVMFRNLLRLGIQKLIEERNLASIGSAPPK
jgi:hypothetical protein